MESAKLFGAALGVCCGFSFLLFVVSCPTGTAPPSETLKALHLASPPPSYTEGQGALWILTGNLLLAAVVTLVCRVGGPPRFRWKQTIPWMVCVGVLSLLTGWIGLPEQSELSLEAWNALSEPQRVWLVQRHCAWFFQRTTLLAGVGLSALSLVTLAVFRLSFVRQRAKSHQYFSEYHAPWRNKGRAWKTAPPEAAALAPRSKASSSLVEDTIVVEPEARSTAVGSTASVDLGPPLVHDPVAPTLGSWSANRRRNEASTRLKLSETLRAHRKAARISAGANKSSSSRPRIGPSTDRRTESKNEEQ